MEMSPTTDPPTTNKEIDTNGVEQHLSDVCLFIAKYAPRNIMNSS